MMRIDIHGSGDRDSGEEVNQAIKLVRLDMFADELLKLLTRFPGGHPFRSGSGV